MYNTVLSLEQYVKDPCWYLGVLGKGGKDNIVAAIHGYTTKIDPFEEMRKFRNKGIYENKLVHSYINQIVSLIQIRHTLVNNTIMVQGALFRESKYKSADTDEWIPYMFGTTFNLPYHQVDSFFNNYSIFPDELNKLISRIPNIYV